MYEEEELVKRMWECASGECFNCSQFTETTNASVCSKELMKQAADAIAKLSHVAEVNAKRALKWASDAEKEAEKHRWISMTEQLPREGEFVLVYGDLYPNKHDGGVIAVSKRMDWNYWQGFGRERNITHWMPLPEPPKEEEE